jgi:hypothetical protein
MVACGYGKRGEEIRDPQRRRLRCLLQPSLVIPEGNANPWRKVWDKLTKRARLINNEHRDISYHHPPYSPIRRWRRLLVFATQVKRKSLRTRTFFILSQCETVTAAEVDRLAIASDWMTIGDDIRGDCSRRWPERIMILGHCRQHRSPNCPQGKCLY